MCQPLSDRDVERCPAGHEPGWSNFEMAIGGRCSITLRLGGRYALLFLGRRNRLGGPGFARFVATVFKQVGEQNVVVAVGFSALAVCLPELAGAIDISTIPTRIAMA